MTCPGLPSATPSHGRSPRSGSRERAIGEAAPSPAAWSAITLAALLTIGCTAPQPSPAPPATSPDPIALRPREPACTHCAALQIEIAQLQLQIARRESELSDLRGQRREQAKALEASSRQAARASARLKRLATRATAASYIAEVEVSMTAATWALPSAPERAQLALAQRYLDSSADLFNRGDYEAAIDRADQAAEVIARVSEAAPPAPTRRSAVVHFGRPKPLRVKIDSNLRKGPSRRAEAYGVLKAGTPVVGHARRGGWVRIATANGRSGWVYRPLLGPR